MLLRRLLLGTLLAATVFFCLAPGRTAGGDWSRFRGPNGTGISGDTRVPPVEWSETKNLKWKAKLPGPGHSSPIVVGDRIFLTCWTGYGTSRASPGDQTDLKRHLLCLDRGTGQVRWTREIAPVLPEEPYRGMFAEHGYASHTPVSDGTRVFVFCGKTGVLAFDMDGKQLWQVSVGKKDDPRGWGTASSPILYKNLVIVPAAIESQTLFAFDQATGKEVWKQPAPGFGGTWGSPILVELPDREPDLVMGVPYEIWAFDPSTGKLRWYCESVESDSMCSSLVAQDGVVYAIEGMQGGSVAVRAGGKDDVTKTHRIWSGRERGRIGTPVVHQGLIYWVSGGIANCLDATTGSRVYQNRIASAAPAPGGREPQPPAPSDPASGGSRGGRGGFGGGGRGGQDYSSPVIAGDRLYYVTRSGDIHVLALGREFKLLATNRFESDRSDYSATPAISDGDLFIRSAAYLYCVGEGT